MRGLRDGETRAKREAWLSVKVEFQAKAKPKRLGRFAGTTSSTVVSWEANVHNPQEATKMATDPITEVVATENQTVATMKSPSVNQTVAQVPSFAATQTVAPTGHVTVPVNHGEKPEKFNGLNFKRWQQKMLFYLTTLNLARFLTEDVPKLKHGLADSLYNVYSTMKTAKELWESLDRKYKTEDAGAKKFIVGRFLDYKMMDSKTVISQVQELQIILHEIHAERMVLSETFQVAAMIEKLPPAWKDFKNYLKHKRKEMNIEELIVRLRIEENNKSSETNGFNP
ncbi:Retrovirus-related Pol polyprotein from transposon TNT 1-94 [Abeliophyllum distichum]|uniref:Retrovirus-related Pol polyprotein from transposon TNT 1-94 n=1 Tax=Abeliophyllum distichum TaxID=126358 RepID=A0ABD1PRH9_9LAMI